LEFVALPLVDFDLGKKRSRTPSFTHQKRR
jgi:hypothetical protein